VSHKNGTVAKSKQPAPQFLDGVRVEYVEKADGHGVILGDPPYVIEWQGLHRLVTKKVTFKKKEGFLTFELKPLSLYKGSLKDKGELREGSMFEFNGRRYALTNPRVLVEK
jgi:hypothetical protein